MDGVSWSARERTRALHSSPPSATVSLVRPMAHARSPMIPAKHPPSRQLFRHGCDGARPSSEAPPFLYRSSARSRSREEPSPDLSRDASPDRRSSSPTSMRKRQSPKPTGTPGASRPPPVRGEFRALFANLVARHLHRRRRERGRPRARSRSSSRSPAAALDPDDDRRLRPRHPPRLREPRSVPAPPLPGREHHLARRDHQSGRAPRVDGDRCGAVRVPRRAFLERADVRGRRPGRRRYRVHRARRRVRLQRAAVGDYVLKAFFQGKVVGKPIAVTVKGPLLVDLKEPLNVGEGGGQ